MVRPAIRGLSPALLFCMILLPYSA
jgi:hypothetical protein